MKIKDTAAPRYGWEGFIVDMKVRTARGIWKSPDWARRGEGEEREKGTDEGVQELGDEESV